MKQIYINNEPTKYFIGENGNLLNKETNHYYKGSVRNGYKWFDLRWKNKKYAMSQHRLLAEYFIPNPNNLPVVNHKDSNRLNNSLNNLEWVSYSINNLQRNKKNEESINSIRNKETQQNLFNEEWKTFRNTKYMVSNFGRVKNTQTNKIMKGKITEAGYKEYCLTFNNKKRSFRANRITAEVFLNFDYNSKLVINHKDGNKLNDNIDNLEICTVLENNLHSFYEIQTHNLKKVGQFDEENNLVNIFLSCAKAAKEMNVKPQSINAAIHKNYKSCGYYWKYVD